MAVVTHQVVTVEGRALHLLRLGSGPPVVLLHESPRSSAVLLPLATALAARFTVLALDTPGYGLSDPLPAQRPEIGDYADAVAGSLRQLGFGGAGGRVPIYGTHTGATVAATLAGRHPDLVSGAVLDGYPVFTAAEKDMYAHLYFATFDPAWDGGTVARLWSRVRDQYTFFPWYLPGEGSRLRRDPPSPAQQNAVIKDLLMAGPHYVPAYAAAFRFDAELALDGARVPIHLATREDDLLFPHLARLRPRPGITVEPLGTDRAAWADRIGAALAGMVEAGSPPVGSGKKPDGSREGTLAVDGELVLRRYGTGREETRPLLLIHDSPGGAWEWAGVARREAERRRVVVPELPGHGHSPAIPSDVDTMRGLLDRLEALMPGEGRFDVAGRGVGAILAHALARRDPGRIGRLVLVDPLLPRAATVSELFPLREPDWHGSHLMSAWYEARDRLLYRPWCARRAERTRVVGPGLDLAEVQGRFTSIVLAENDHLPVAHAAMEEADALLSDGFIETHAVLLAGDPDTADLTIAFRDCGVGVTQATYDALADTVVAALRADAGRGPATG